jgi:hypothetical protein
LRRGAPRPALKRGQRNKLNRNATKRDLPSSSPVRNLSASKAGPYNSLVQKPAQQSGSVPHPHRVRKIVLRPPPRRDRRIGQRPLPAQQSVPLNTRRRVRRNVPLSIRPESRKKRRNPS